MDEYTVLNSEQIKSEMEAHKDKLNTMMWSSFFHLGCFLLELIVLVIVWLTSFNWDCRNITTTFGQEKQELKSFIKLYL